MKIYLGADHAGFELKEKIKGLLKKLEKDFEDCGAYEFDKEDDYPIYVRRTAKKVSEDEGSRGIVLGGSGQGEAIAANKFANVRCALFYTPAIAYSAIDITGRMSENAFQIIRLAREHNDANMLSLGARFLKEKDAMEAVGIFLKIEFGGEARHKRRIGMLE
jgi:ribose 5-phosphate isomerase B